MAAYCFVNVNITDPNRYGNYRSRTLATIETFGGRFIVRGGVVDVKEGQFQPHRLIILEFPSMERAQAWYSSPAYQSIIPYRQDSAQTDLLLVEGV